MILLFNKLFTDWLHLFESVVRKNHKFIEMNYKLLTESLSKTLTLRFDVFIEYKLLCNGELVPALK